MFLRGEERRQGQIDAAGLFLVYYRREFFTPRGRLAQLGERHVRNVEVEGSNPLPSTIFSALCSETEFCPAQNPKCANDVKYIGEGADGDDPR
jgi:hypothetical protein